eukprot:2282876-Alexandrium_andersonii.AAC.1
MPGAVPGLHLSTLHWKPLPARLCPDEHRSLSSQPVPPPGPRPAPGCGASVSYTHLTLPTICSV